MKRKWRVQNGDFSDFLMPANANKLAWKVEFVNCNHNRAIIEL